MSLTPWRSPLARALHLNRSLVYARYFQLATIGNNGYPANRTVVFRGFLEETNQIKIITDSRSQKASQIKDHPQGEICWYFPKSREQFRFQGLLTLVTGEDVELQPARWRVWQDISLAARSQFFGAAPGELQAMGGEVMKGGEIEKVERDTIAPSANFCLLLLDPIEVDHLELRGDRQNRHQYLWNGTNWIMTLINP